MSLNEAMEILGRYELLFLIHVIIYGIGFGVRNTLIRIWSIFSTRYMIQNGWGKLFDACFYFSLGTLVLLEIY